MAAFDLDIVKLRNVLDMMMSAIMEHHTSGKVSIDSYYYWDIDQLDMFAIDGDMPMPSMGNLLEDYDVIQKIAQDSGFLSPQCLQNAAALLRYIAKITPA